MASLLGIVAAILQAGSYTLDKVILSLRGVNFKTYTGISFPLVFAITLLIFIFLRPPLPLRLFSGRLLWLLLASITLAIATNLIFYRALDHDRLGEIQTVDLFVNLPIILLAATLFTDERKLLVVVPALIASSALIWAHWQHHHLVIAPRTVPFVLWGLTGYPLAASVTKILLRSWNPIPLELVRSGVMAIVLGFAFRHEIKKASRKAGLLLLTTNVLTSVAMILFYFSYQRVGVVHTLLLYSVQPVLVYVTSLVFLKERLESKRVVAFCIVLVCIVFAQTVTSLPRTL